MAIVWHFGNTTLRNPARLAEGLKVLYNSQYHGNLVGKDNEMGYAYALRDAGVIDIKDSTEDCSSSGRKWRACFHQLGFITYKPSASDRGVFIDAVEQGGLNDIDPDGQFELTPNGHRLIASDNAMVQQEAMLRALLAYEIPSIIETGYSFDTFKPFIFVLEVIKELVERGEKGLSKYEFVIATRYHNNSDVDLVVDEIISFRRNREEYDGNKKEFDKIHLDGLYPNESENAKNTISKDYPDLIVRYSRFTGLFKLDGRRLTLNDEKIEMITEILASEPNIISTTSQSGYLAKLWKGAEIPTDNSDIRLREVKRYLGLLDRGSEISGLSALSDDDINLLRHELEEEYHKVREIEYAKKQAEEVEDIIYYLKELTKRTPSAEAGIYDRPAFLEWALWRSFLAINSLVNMPYEARRFRVDHEFYPLRCAAGGGPDMIFEFQDYILVVEVTLTSSSRQEAAEGESVRRHVAQIDHNNNPSGKPVYGLFIAQSIDNNTAEVFRIGVWYRGDVPHFLNIVPLTIDQFISILERFNTPGVDKDTIRKILDSCLIPRNAHAPVWKTEINSIMSALQ